MSALDVSIQAQLLALFAGLRTDLGVALLFISHDLAVIHEVCDRVIVMKDGRVLETGEVQRLFTTPHDPYTEQLLQAARWPAADPAQALTATASRRP